ncbi:copper homeostasis protein [Arthrobacter sp. V4I6]|uniref:copper homeostasis protein CutC n=1 Tax=unclassified Arthrobacter TaxID=235627 RepID=UPI00277D54CB|nr:MULTISPECIES: copper homeostasis protein CutC [unclassified Arthrobacter]MDQ0819565.1 copper homeostasis protein [Arthrobacter sp. V1I7]MDQ0853746.1 copper homeostasis protein [Arthrobacter sp. V4I6]
MELEIAVVSAEGAGIAAAEGAGRIELCSSLELGGITPSQGLMDAAAERSAGRLEIHPLIRCRPGGFIYSAAELDTMGREAQHLLMQGAHGVVFGALTPGGEVDLTATRRLVECVRNAKPTAQLTFHRAVDQIPKVEAALDVLIGLGFTRVLSSGQAASAGAGQETLARMARFSAGRLQIMAGGGLRIPDIPTMKRSGLDAVHLSAKKTVSTLRPGAVFMDPRNGTDPTAYHVTDAEIVRAARAACDW